MVIGHLITTEPLRPINLRQRSGRRRACIDACPT